MTPKVLTDRTDFIDIEISEFGPLFNGLDLFRAGGGTRAFDSEPPTR